MSFDKDNNSMLQQQLATAMADRKNRNMHAELCIEEYFRLKKNLTIAALLSANTDIVIKENPAIIFVLQSESVYNVHTQKLILSGGTPEGFISHINTTYSEYLQQMNVDTAALGSILTYCYGNGVLVEFIDLSKMTIDEYIKQWIKDDKNDKCQSN